MDSLYIVMPAYNEEANIANVIREWYPLLEGKAESSRLVVADGGSADNTLPILCELQRKYPQLVVLSRPGTDHGTKLLVLYDYAVRNNIDYIFQTDSDGQTNPGEFDQFWKKEKSMTLYWEIVRTGKMENPECLWKMCCDLFYGSVSA